MSRLVTLPFGSRPYKLKLPPHVEAAVIDPPAPGRMHSLDELLGGALDSPIGAPRLQDAVPPGARVTIVVSDATRDDPRTALLRALLVRMPEDIEVTLAVANGTHGPSDLARLTIESDVLARVAHVVNHDGRSNKDLVTVGQTQRGTPVRVHRCVVDADWVIATGRIKPHYFAGYGAGCKAIFPGLGANREIRINHQLKREPGARPGKIEGNPCREDLEEAVRLVPSRKYLLNVILNEDNSAHGAVAGDLEQAFRTGAGICEPLYRIEAPRAPIVIVSDRLPLTGSLYQASKLVAAAAALLEDGGTMIVVAACPNGIGGVETVNKAIYDTGLAPRLPARHRLILVSELDADTVRPSYCQWAGSVEVVLEELGPEVERVTVVTHAGALIIDPVSWPW